MPSTNGSINNGQIFPTSADDSNGNHLSVSVKGKVITKRRAIFAHIIFTCINFLNYTDRYTIAGVLSDIQDYFHIGDTAGGLIQTVFILVYMCFAPLFGYLGDRWTRRNILMGGILAWSFFTLMGSFVGRHQFWLFLLIRGLVGIGESSYITVSPALIGDLFSESERMLALSIFSFAAPFGAGFGYILGSGVTSVAKSAGADDTSAWQWSLRVTPILGVLAVALTALFVPEPARGARESGNDSGAEIMVETSFKEDVLYLVKNKTAVLVTVAYTAVTYVLGCLSFWAPSFLEDAYLALGQNPNNTYISLGFGAVTCACGVLGVALGSFLAKTYLRKKSNAEPLVSAYGLLLAGPLVFCVAIVVEYSPAAIWPFVVLGEIALCLNWALVPKILIDCVVPNRRAFASGLSTGVTHLFGDAYSPFFVGLIADATYGNSSHYNQFKGLQLGVLTCPIVCVLGAAAFFACAIVYDQDKARTAEIVEQNARSRKNARAQSNRIDSHFDPHSEEEEEGDNGDESMAILDGNNAGGTYDTEPLM